MHRIPTVLLILASLCSPAFAAREMTTDRPDTTESPFTIEPGHFQLEMSFVEFSQDNANPQRASVHVNEWNFAPFNLRVGLTENSDLHVIFETHHLSRIDDRTTGRVDKFSGYGDVTLRMKWNFWGNDGGPSALGIMPFVKLPTGSNDFGNHHLEGGVILPASFELPAGWGLSVMTEWDLARNRQDDGYDNLWVNSASFSHSIAGPVDGFIELVSQVGGPPVVTLNGGISWDIGENLKWDLGANFALTRAADDMLLFTGISWRH
jgi:hypothetical protein